MRGLAPRHNVLLYLNEYGNITSGLDLNILYERLNCTLNELKLIFKDLYEKKLISWQHLKISNRDSLYLLPEQNSKLEIVLTDVGKDYIERKILKQKSNISFTSDSLDYIKIGNTDYRLPMFENSDYESFESQFNGKLSVDIRIVYFLLTGKVVSGSKPRVFISYSWGDLQHEKWVFDLAQRLKFDFDIRIDKEIFKVGMERMEAMKQEIIQADKVLVVLTPSYKEKADNASTGVAYEGSIINQELKKYLVNSKYVPLLREGDRKSSIPQYLENYFDYDARKGKYKFMGLVRVLKS